LAKFNHGPAPKRRGGLLMPLSSYHR